MEQLAPFGELLNPEERQYLVDHGTVRSVIPGERICVHQQLDCRVYLLVIGEVAVTEGVERRELTRLGPGEMFGEIGALFRLPRIADVTATKPSVVLELPGDVLEKIIAGRPELHSRLVEEYHKRITRTALHTAPLFSHLPDDLLERLADQASLVGIPAGGSIVMQDEQGDALYVIVHGSVTVTQETADGPREIARLRGGDHFGERSFLTGEARNATVTALMRIEALRFDFPGFQAIIRDYPALGDGMKRHHSLAPDGDSAVSASHRASSCH